VEVFKTSTFATRYTAFYLLLLNIPPLMALKCVTAKAEARGFNPHAFFIRAIHPSEVYIKSVFP